MKNSNHRAPPAPIFAQLNILDIFKVNSLYIAKYMFSYYHRLLRSPFLNLFLTSGQTHNYDHGQTLSSFSTTYLPSYYQTIHSILSRAKDKDMECFAINNYVFP